VVLNIVNAFIVWCFYPETAGQTLESVDRPFITDEAEKADAAVGRKVPLHQKAQWSVVRNRELL
jgi:hypothetical protein